MTAGTLQRRPGPAGDGTSRYEAIAATVQERIRLGQWRPGERLPTVRRLAEELGVGVSTVAAAYDLLTRSGWARGEVGRGTFVLGQPAAAPNGGAAYSAPRLGAPSASGAAPRNPLTVAPWRRRVLTTTEQRLLTAYPNALNCIFGSAGLTTYPLDALRRAWATAAEALTSTDLQYRGPSVVPALAQTVLPWLEADGIPARAEDIVVAAGFHQVLQLALNAVPAWSGVPELGVAVEEPGYPHALDTFERAGRRVLGVAVDAEGAVPASLEQALRAGATLALLTPRAHNPTGLSWSARRVHELADVLATHPGVVVVEDDYFGGVAAARPGTLLADPRLEERVIYVRSVSKTISADFRVAIVVVRSCLHTWLREAKSYADGWSSRLAQRALANVLADPDLAETLARARVTYTRCRQVLSDALDPRLAAVGGSIAGGEGINFWIWLPFGVDAADVIERAAALGVLAAPGEPFFVRPGHGGAIRVNIGQLSGLAPAQITAAGVALAKAIGTASVAPTIAIAV